MCPSSAAGMLHVASTSQQAGTCYRSLSKAKQLAGMQQGQKLARVVEVPTRSLCVWCKSMCVELCVCGSGSSGVAEGQMLPAVGSQPRQAQNGLAAKAGQGW